MSRRRRFNYSMGFQVGTEVTVHCSEGYVLSGQSKLRCLSNGNWNDTLPVCLGK